MNLVAVGEEPQPLPADRLLHVDAELEVEPPDIARALLEAADRIAEHVADVVDGVRDAASGERRAHAGGIAEVLRKIDGDRGLRNAGSAIALLVDRLGRNGRA